MQLVTIDDLLNGDPAEVDTLVAKASGISEVYKKYFAEDPGDTKERKPGIHASEISGCLRRLVYSINGTEREEKSAPDWKRRFKVGHAIHDMFQKDFRRMAKMSKATIEFEDEVRIYPCAEQPLAAKWDIQSSTDGLFAVREEPGGPVIYRCLLEIKTESPAGYEELKGVKLDHKEQGHVYMACLNVPLIWFLYYNKGNQNFTPSTNPSFFMRFDPKVWQGLEERFEKAHILAATGELPPREEGIKCEFCAFSHECKPAYLNKIRGVGHAATPKHWGKKR